MVHPFTKESDRDLIRDTKVVTLIVGAASCAAGLFAPTILSLLSKAYSFAGAGVVPLIVIGLIWKEKKDLPSVPFPFWYTISLLPEGLSGLLRIQWNNPL